MEQYISKIEIIKQVLTLPDKIRTKEAELLQLNRTKVELDTQLKSIENDTLIAVTNEIDENNKAKYSNDIKRKSEVKERLSKLPLFIDTKNRYELVCNNLDDLQIQYSYIKNLFRSYEIVSRLG